MRFPGYGFPAKHGGRGAHSNNPYLHPDRGRQHPGMTTTPGQDSRPAPRDHDHASQYLAAIVASLTAQGTGCRLTRDGGVSTLTIEEPCGAPTPTTIVIDPGNGPGFWIDCTCIWTPPAGTTPEAAADTILAVLNAIRPIARTDVNPAMPLPASRRPARTATPPAS
jgi:hypothetical protein